MITKKELGFVSYWVKKVPYPGIEYATAAMEKLSEAINYYEKYYNNKEYELVLSNSDQLSFQIQSKNLCHLLGVDYQNLSGDYFENYRTEILGFDDSSKPKSYELLQKIVENFNVENLKKINFMYLNKSLTFFSINL